MKKPNGGPMFPVKGALIRRDAHGELWNCDNIGVSYRQWLAGLAMAALINDRTDLSHENLAYHAHKHADAMIAEGEKE